MDEVDVYKIAIAVLRDTINYQNEDVDVMSLELLI